MRKKLLFVALLSVMATTFAQEKIKDVRTKPDLYFLQIGEVANSLELLPPPPQPGSILFLNDEAQYQWGLMQRRTPRGDQAVSDARVDGAGVPNAFSEAFGIKISKETTPEIFKLVVNMREDAGDLATRAAKEHYMRVRPFAFYEKTIGWATALVLAEINVDRQNEILKRGYEMGQSRVICGYHFQSDVDAARLVASAVVARLHANDAFMKQLEKAKKEFESLVKKGKVKKSERMTK